MQSQTKNQGLPDYEQNEQLENEQKNMQSQKNHKNAYFDHISYQKSTNIALNGVLSV